MMTFSHRAARWLGAVTSLLPACTETQPCPPPAVPVTPPPPPAPSARPASNDPLAPSTFVVASPYGTYFIEGKIESAGELDVTIARGTGERKSTDEVPRARVWPAAKGLAAAAKTGDALVCRTRAGSWEGCVVTAVGQGYYTLETEHDTVRLEAQSLVAPSPAVQGDIHAAIDRRKADAAANDRARAFEADAKMLRPRVPAKWKPAVGDEVLAFGFWGWVPGKITAVAASGAPTVQRDGDPPEETTLDQLAPMPTQPQKVDPGQFVLVRNRHAPDATAGWDRVWHYYRATAVNGTQLDVVDASGATRTVDSKDVLPLE